MEKTTYTRPTVKGKFLYRGNDKFYIKGITYGPFKPFGNGSEFGTKDSVHQDFSRMAAYGINTVRTYTVPPVWLLDITKEYDLHLFIGLPWEQHITFLNERRIAAGIRRKTQEATRSVAGHPAILGYAIGNEISAQIVRWHGKKSIERFLRQLFDIVKREDHDSLVTYVNYPTTEYLELPFIDFFSFNVYLETPDKLAPYLSRLQNLAGDKPLVLGELGLDSMRNGEQKQAEVLSWQLEMAFAEGSAGVFVFSWTDEWYRGGIEIEDWAFGLTDRNRVPKPALFAVSERNFSSRGLGIEVEKA